MADTLNYLAERKINGLQEIQKATYSILDRIDENTATLKQIEAKLGDIREVMELKEDLCRLKPVIQTLKSGKESVTYRRSHEGDLLLYRRARTKLKQDYSSLRGIPEKKLQAEYRKLYQQKNALYEERGQMKKDLKDMETAKHNLEQVLGKEKRIERRMELSL